MELSSSDTRTASTADIINKWRQFTEDIREMPGVKSLEFKSAMGDSAGAPIDFELSGTAIETLGKTVEEIKQALSGYRGVSDIRDTSIDRKPEIRLSIKEIANSLGITLGEVARQVRHAFYGKKVRTIQRGAEEVPGVCPVSKGRESTNCKP